MALFIKKGLTDLLTTESTVTVPPPVLKTTYVYTPYIKTEHLQQVLIKYWNLIAGDQQLSHLFPNHPIIAYERALNLQKI